LKKKGHVIYPDDFSSKLIGIIALQTGSQQFKEKDPSKYSGQLGDICGELNFVVANFQKN